MRNYVIFEAHYPTYYLSFWAILIACIFFFTRLPFVIYMSIRIRNENYTRNDLIQELSGNTLTVKAMELGNFKAVEIA